MLNKCCYDIIIITSVFVHKNTDIFPTNERLNNIGGNNFLHKRSRVLQMRQQPLRSVPTIDI